MVSGEDSLSSLKMVTYLLTVPSHGFFVPAERESNLWCLFLFYKDTSPIQSRLDFYDLIKPNYLPKGPEGPISKYSYFGVKGSTYEFG